MPAKLQNKPVVYLAIDETTEMMVPTAAAPGNSAAAACSELPDRLVVAAGDYCWVNQSWSFVRNGVARFAFWCSLPNSACTAEQMIIAQQRIVYDGKNITALLSSIAWLSAHGSLDVGVSPAALNTAALTRKLSTDSGALVRLALSLIAPTVDVGLSRAVTVAAAEPATVSTKYGRASQTLLEVHDGSDWIVRPPPNKSLCLCVSVSPCLSVSLCVPVSLCLSASLATHPSSRYMTSTTTASH